MPQMSDEITCTSPRLTTAPSRTHTPVHEGVPLRKLSLPPSAYETGCGNFQALYDADLLAQLASKHEALVEQAERTCPWPKCLPSSIYKEIDYLERCGLIFREAKRALQQGQLTAWIHTFTTTSISQSKSRRGPSHPVPLLVKAKKYLETMSKVDRERYGPALAELQRDVIECEEHSDAVMDAVIAMVWAEQLGDVSELHS